MRRIVSFAAALSLFSASSASALTPLEIDDAGRMVAPVTINGQGPYRLILDTGANRTVLAAHVAADLGLNAETETPLLGVAGAARASTVRVAHLQSGSFERRDIPAAILSGQMLADADGIIGMDGFRGKRLVIHMRAGAFDLEEGGAPLRPGFIAVPGRLRFGSLLEVALVIEGIAVRGFVDTGADATLANDALLQALNARVLEREMTVVGAGAEHETYRVRLNDVRFGALEIDQLDVYHADLPHARNADGGETPALVIGMDVWRLVNAIAIDFVRAELQIEPMRSKTALA